MTCPRPHWILFLAPALIAQGAEPGFNYAEALQKSLYFYEAQQSGRLSPNNRVAWRGPACLNDGQDIQRDLSGGWFDAGDHWTANLTMAFAAMTLAWSAVEHPEAYLDSGQMDELLESLVHVNDYFDRCVLNPDCPDPAKDLEVAIGCGGREGVEDPNVHAMWASAELAHRMTRRPTFRLNRRVPGGDVPAAMAAAMAASSMVIRAHGALLQRKPGFTTFEPRGFADRLLDRAGKLVRFARANAGPAITNKLPQDEQDRIQKARNLALRSDGKVVEIGYRAGPFDKIVAAASWLQRAHLARDPGHNRYWFELACEVYAHEYEAEENQGWWKDYSAGNFGKIAAFNLMRLDPADARFHSELQSYALSFCQYQATPGGLRLREWFAHEYGSLRHANNAAVIALYYSEYALTAPEIPGNTWWKQGKSNAELQADFIREARRQVDYALGANPYRRSYLVGFGQQPFNHVHHRGAYGPWAGFEHFIPGKADDRSINRHILYGALVAGPDHNDVFLCGKDRRPWLPLPNTNTHGFYYRFPNRPEPIPKETYRWNPQDDPVQDVMDSQFNEVALDYNAGFTASLAWLTAHGLSAGLPIPDEAFPPPEPRDANTDLRTTDREFFASARLAAQPTNAVEIEIALHNRSRWPARASDQLRFRYHFTLDGPTQADQVQASLSGAPTAKLGPVTSPSPRHAYVEVSFPGDPIYPGDLKTGTRAIRLRLSAPHWDNSNDWSGADLTDHTRLQPRIPVYRAEELVGGQAP